MVLKPDALIGGIVSNVSGVNDVELDEITSAIEAGRALSPISTPFY
jgi:hypothetical protein